MTAERETAFWDHARQGRLFVGACARCGRRSVNLNDRCMSCGSTAVEWAGLDGSGVVYSLTTIHRRDGPPQTVVLVDVEGARAIGLWTGGDEPSVGDRAELSRASRREGPLSFGPAR